MATWAVKLRWVNSVYVPEHVDSSVSDVSDSLVSPFVYVSDTVMLSEMPSTTRPSLAETVNDAATVFDQDTVCFWVHATDVPVGQPQSVPVPGSQHSNSSKANAYS